MIRCVCDGEFFHEAVGVRFVTVTPKPCCLRAWGLRPFRYRRVHVPSRAVAIETVHLTEMAPKGALDALLAHWSAKLPNDWTYDRIGV